MVSRSVILPPTQAVLGCEDELLTEAPFFSVGGYHVSWSVHLTQSQEDVLSDEDIAAWQLTCGVSMRAQPDSPPASCTGSIQATAAFTVQFGLQEHRRMKPVTRTHDDKEVVHYVDIGDLAPLIQAQESGDVTVTLHLLALSPLLGPPLELEDTAYLTPWRSAAGRDFQAFYAASFTDCAVRTSDGASIRCHRVVLSSASRVFETTFSTGMKEAEQQEVSIGDADPAAVRLLLQHAYGFPKSPVPLLLLLPLLELAERYDMQALRDAASGWLCTHNLSARALAALLPQARALGLGEVHKALAERMPSHVDECADGGLLCGWQLEDVALLLDKAGGNFAAFRAAFSWVRLSQESAADVPKSSGSSDGGGAGFDAAAAWVRLLPLVRFKGVFTAKELAAVRALQGAGCIAGLHEKLLEAWEEIALPLIEAATSSAPALGRRLQRP